MTHFKCKKETREYGIYLICLCLHLCFCTGPSPILVWCYLQPLPTQIEIEFLYSVKIAPFKHLLFSFNAEAVGLVKHPPLKYGFGLSWIPVCLPLLFFPRSIESHDLCHDFLDLSLSLHGDGAPAVNTEGGVGAQSTCWRKASLMWVVAADSGVEVVLYKPTNTEDSRYSP